MNGFMKLDQFLKWKGIVDTGGQAKHFIVSGQVSVNNSIETRRGRKLVEGDRIFFAKKEYTFSKIDTQGRKLGNIELMRGLE